MGEGAYIRIQNKSQHALKIKVVEGKKVDDRGMDAIQGTIEPGEQLPRAGEAPFSDHRRYQYIEGDVRFFFQGDGYFHLEAHPVSGAPPSGLKLLVDSDEWRSEDPSPDHDSPVLTVADVDDDDGGKTRIEIRVFDNYSGSGWMGQLGDDIGDVPFNRVALPGTHDSGTYAFNSDLGAAPDSDLTTKIDDILGGIDALADVVLKQIFKKLCRCQTLDFGGQLEEGIRYFDMRIGAHAETDTFHTCHGVYCVEMSAILDQFREFLDGNSKEVVILDFNHLYAMDGRHEDLIDMVLDAFGDKVARLDQVKASSPLNEYWERGYQVVIVYHNNEMSKETEKYKSLLWPGGYVRSPWPNAGTTDALRLKLKALSVEKRHPAAFFVMQGILTPNGGLVKKQIMSAEGISIKSFAPGCNARFVDWITGDSDGHLKLTCNKEGAESEEENGRANSIVIVDYVENGNIIPAVINSNRTG